MLWTTLRLNLANTAAIGALFLLPIITSGITGLDGTSSSGIAPAAAAENGYSALTAPLPGLHVAPIATPSTKPIAFSGADRCFVSEPAFCK